VYRDLLTAVAVGLVLTSGVQAWAPYVGASEADNEFWRITPAHMAVISVKKGMVTSRSFGQNLMGGVGNMAAKNPMYKCYYSTNVISLLNYPTDPLTAMPATFFEPTSSYAPNNRILHYLCQITPLTNRIDHFEYYLSTAPYQFANILDWGFIEYHPDNGMSDVAFFNSYKAKTDAMAAAHPTMKIIRVTAGLWPQTGRADNEAAWTFSDRVMNPANGIYGQAPIYDWRNILSTHPDGTSAGHMMCLEYNTGDQTHPNQPFIQERLGRGLLLMLYKLYCNPPLTANAGFDRTWYDNDENGSETVTLDGSASYDPGATQIVSYTWREGDAVLANTVTASVSLALGTHALTLTVANNAAPPATSVDTVVVKVVKPKLLFANAGPDQTVINANPPHTIAEGVTLDGGGSMATGGRTIVSYVWKDAGRQISTARAPGINLENGVHPITLTVTDNGTPPNTDTDMVVVSIIEPAVRTSEGVQALYAFKETSGTTVNDTSCAYATPLNMTIGTPAAAAWLGGGGGLQVNGAAAIATPGAATRIYNACLASLGDVTLEAWVQPANALQNGPACILTMSGDHSTRNFTLGHGEVSAAARYNARLRGTGTTNNGEPALLSPDGSATTALQHVVYTRQGNGTTTMYINGSQVASGIHEGLLDVWNNTYRLGLADEIIGGRPWLGKLYLAAIYNRVLTADEVGRNYTVGTSPPTPYAPRILGFVAPLVRGEQDQELLSLTETPVYVDCRKGALNTVWAVFAKPLNPATVSKSSIAVTGTRGGNLASLVDTVTLDSTRRVIVIKMLSMPKADKVRFQVNTTVRDAWNQAVTTLWLPFTVNLNVTVGVLVGDVNGDGRVGEADLLAVRDHAGQSATGANAKYDVDCSGEITGADLLPVRENLDATLP